MDGSIVVILNPRAGLKSTPDAETCREAFARYGHDVRVVVLAAQDDSQALLDDALNDDVRCVVAAGGDGTVNAVAQRIVGQPHKSLGILPLGTLNHFARDLGIPDDLDRAVQVIVAGARASVDVGEVNERIFLNNASMGLYATILAHREHDRRHRHLSKWLATAKATWSVLRHPSGFDVEVAADGQRHHWHTSVLFVGNNDYTVQGPALGRRMRLDAGLLSIYALRPKGRWGLLWLGLRALAGWVSGDLEAHRAQNLVTRATRDRVTVALDGEIATLDSPLRFSSCPGALQVLTPGGRAGAEG